MNAVARLGTLALVPFVAGWAVGALWTDRSPGWGSPSAQTSAPSPSAVGADGGDVAARTALGQRPGLWDLIASAPSGDLPFLASAASTLGEPHRFHALKLVTTHWLAVDAPAAAVFIGTEPGLEPFLPDFYEAWIRLDPRGFARDVEFPLRVSDPTETLAQLALVERKLAEKLAADPVSGTRPDWVLERAARLLEIATADAEFALAMEDPAAAIDAGAPRWERVFTAWTRQEPARAIDYGIRKLEEGDRGRAVDRGLAESLLGRWDLLSDEQLARVLASAPGAAFSDGYSNPDPFAEMIEPVSIPLHRLEAALGRGDVMRAGSNPELEAFLAAAYGAENPAGGIRFLDGLGDDGTAPLDAAKAFFNAWRTRDAEAACDWAAAQPPSVLLSLARVLPGADYGLDVAPDPFRPPPPQSSQLSDADLAMAQAARVAFESLDPELLSTHLSDSLPLLRIMPEPFTGLLQTRPDGVDPSDYRMAVSLLVEHLGQSDPAGAMQWLADLGDPAVRDSVTKEVLLDAFDVSAADPFADPPQSIPPQAPIEYARALDPAEREAFVATALALAAPVDDGPFAGSKADPETIERLESLIREVDVPPATRGEFFEQLDRIRAAEYAGRGEGG